MNEDLKKSDIVLAPLSYLDLVNDKLRPSLILYHDMDVMQLTVAYISSKVPANPAPYEIVIPLGTPTSTRAGLIYPSVVKVHWVAMVKRILVKRKLGEADEDLREKVNRILPQAFLFDIDLFQRSIWRSVFNRGFDSRMSYLPECEIALFLTTSCKQTGIAEKRAPPQLCLP